MPKPPPKPPSLFPDASRGGESRREPPQTVTVDQVVESVRTGVPLDVPPEPADQTSGEHQNAPPETHPAPETPPADQTPPQPQPERPKSTEPESPPIKDPVSYNPANASELYRYVRMLARSSLLPKAFYHKGDYEKKSPKIDDVHFVCLKGQFLGLHPMIAIGNINVIDGKAEVGALLMLAMVRKSGLMIPGGWKLVHSDEHRAVFKTRRVGDEDWTEFEYTIEEADLMGLLDKGRDEAARANNQWRRQPRTMLRRRCQSMLLREVYPDVVIGMYDHGELEEMREREMAMGIDPDRVIPMNGVTQGSGADRAQAERVGAWDNPALPEPSGPGPIERMVRRSAEDPPVDPLKVRLQARAAAAGIRRCSECGDELDPRDSDPCIGCRPVDES